MLKSFFNYTQLLKADIHFSLIIVCYGNLRDTVVTGTKM